MNDSPTEKKPFYQNIVDKKTRKKDSSRTKKNDSSDFKKKTYPEALTDSKSNPRDKNRFSPSIKPNQDHPSRMAKPYTPRSPFTPPKQGLSVFSSVPKETQELLESFFDIVQSVMPLDSKKIQNLPQEIRNLSHELTDERSDRKIGYLNDPAVLGAYIRYYQWWNLVRLTRLFTNLPLTIEDEGVAVDLGSGPLTVPIALWMSRPDLRTKKITWYCVDLSQNALSAGEEIFLALAAKTQNTPWEIIRIKGECGVSVRRKVSLVTSANMFNELYWDNPEPIEAQVKHHAESLVSYADQNAQILVVEPGIPRSGRFISLLRDALLRKNFEALSPCPHQGLCPLPGLRHGKWCHFVFDTTDAPQKLHKLSESAYLTKERAALSFLLAARGDRAQKKEVSELQESSLSTVSRLTNQFSLLTVRVSSDPIKLPDYFTGRYACSELGLVLITGKFAQGDYLKNLEFGALLEVPRPKVKNPERDEKTGALLVRL